MRLRGVIVAALKDQRFFRGVSAALDLTDEDDMIAFFISAAVEAFEPRAAAFEHRCAARAFAPRDAVEAVDREFVCVQAFRICG